MTLQCQAYTQSTFGPMPYLLAVYHSPNSPFWRCDVWRYGTIAGLTLGLRADRVKHGKLVRFR